MSCQISAWLSAKMRWKTSKDPTSCFPDFRIVFVVHPTSPKEINLTVKQSVKC